MTDKPVTAPGRQWLARLPGESPREHMQRIRQTCRWCGEYFGDSIGTARMRLGRHEMEHVQAEDE